ncbi:hypothetical protein [Erwinia psidii]|uniref:Uncharacterized protein n=1 Tax=Erwinia psidii TaxID=69224 RepID=A0A3N6UU21_9GAMM|nr:hypothetical protein [Erwinia psidii]MCX8957729.1 hypothetical protein [Erwinia psidii]RQM39459.1 hypothetical protein EB241_03235 [Erwinia psidii]
MKLNSPKKPISALFFMCFLMCIALIFLGIFSYLLKGWLVWDFNKPFPFGKAEIVTILKISLLGIPTGLVFWIFDVR